MREKTMTVCRRLGFLLIASAGMVLVSSFTYWALIAGKNRIIYYDHPWTYEVAGGPSDEVRLGIDRDCAMPFAQRRFDASSTALEDHLARQPTADPASLSPLDALEQGSWIRRREVLEKDYAISAWLIDNIGTQTIIRPEADLPSSQAKEYVGFGGTSDIGRYYLEKRNGGYFRKLVSSTDALAGNLGLLPFSPLVAEEILAKCAFSTPLRKVLLPPVARSDISLFPKENQEALDVVNVLVLLGLTLIFLVGPTIAVFSRIWSWLVNENDSNR